MIDGNGKRAFRIMLLVMLACCLAMPLMAQEQPATEAAEEEIPDEWKAFVGEVTVTAQKREQDIQDVPMSLTAMPKEDLEVITTGGADIRALSGRVPSLVMESSFGRMFPRFYIRGLGNTDFDLNASQPVSMVFDEIVLENPIVKAMPLFDVERVEVLRGPQGTLFGRNTPAGVVKFDSVKPTQERDGFAKLSYGTYDTTDIQFGIGGGLTKTLSARVSGMYQGRSDWVENEYEPGPEDKIGGYSNSAYRIQLLWEPDENLDFLFNVHGWTIDGTARIFRANILDQGSNELNDNFEFDRVSIDGVNKQEIDSIGGLLRIDYDFGGATLTALTGYESLDMFSRGDVDGGFGASFAPPFGPGFIPFYAESADGLPDLTQITQELRVASNGGGAVDWLFGLFYFSEEIQVDTFAYTSIAPGNPLEGYSVQFQSAESFALFGNFDFHLGESWDLSVGLRYSADEKKLTAERPVPTFQTPTFAPIVEEVDDTDLSGNLSLTFKASDTVNIYGRVATGYRAPSIQGRILFCADFEGGQNPATNCVTTADTEKIISGELGIKTILANQKLRLNLTAYIYEVDGQQLSAVGGEFNTATLLNADTTDGHGIEADMQWTPSGNWLMTFGYSWNPTEINDPNLTVAPCGGGCTITNPIIDGLVYIDGNPLPHAPEHIFNGIISFRSDPVNKGFIAALDWAYLSERNFFLYESEEFKADSLEFGLRLGYGWSQGKFEVAAWGRNITNAEINQGGIDFVNLTGMTNDPQIIGLEFLARF